MNMTGDKHRNALSPGVPILKQVRDSVLVTCQAPICQSPVRDSISRRAIHPQPDKRLHCTTKHSPVTWPGAAEAACRAQQSLAACARHGRRRGLCG